LKSRAGIKRLKPIAAWDLFPARSQTMPSHMQRNEMRFLLTLHHPLSTKAFPSDASKAESSAATDTKIQDKKIEMLKIARSFGS